jgi:L-alanine-DL-glutamate epimerase-like enolase superfamily enzyme
MADEAARLGLGLMVGNMCGTSLAMAPAFLLAQRCAYVDLDGPLLQKRDREHAMLCDKGLMQPPTAALWG